MIEGIPVAFLQGVGLLGAIAFIFYMVATGKSGTPREMKDNREEILWLRQTVAEKDTQVQTLLAERASVLELMVSIRRLAEQITERDPK
jgi:hypothetical protein